MKIPAVFSPYIEVFQALDGHGQLWSPSTGQFLGRLCSKSDYINSIINPKGDYGSSYSDTSIHNPLCPYGGEKGQYSPFNPNCQNPPIVFYRNKPLFVLSTNLNLKTDGLRIMDPYLLLTIYEAIETLFNTSREPEQKTSSQIKLVRLGPSHEQLMEKLTSLSGSAFGWSQAS